MSGEKEMRNVSQDETREIETVKSEVPIMAFDAQALISQAIDKNTPIETMERLLAMRKELKKEAARDAFFKALAGFQAECPIIEKKTPVYNKGKVRYKYATLDDIVSQVKALLLKHGFSYIIKSIQDDKGVGAICRAFHELGHAEESEFKVPIDAAAYMNVAQKVASALTFSKRYAFCDIFGIMTGTGDDDADMTGDPGQGVPENIPARQQKQPGNNYNSVPEENQGMYTAIMRLIREKVRGKDLFIPTEKADNKKKADSVIGDHESLKKLYRVLNKIAQERRAVLNKG